MSGYLSGPNEVTWALKPKRRQKVWSIGRIWVHHWFQVGGTQVLHFQLYAQLTFLEASFTQGTLHLRVHFQEIQDKTLSLFIFAEESYSRILKWVKWKLHMVKINLANFLGKSDISVFHLSTSLTGLWSHYILCTEEKGKLIMKHKSVTEQHHAVVKIPYKLGRASRKFSFSHL